MVPAANAGRAGGFDDAEADEPGMVQQGNHPDVLRAYWALRRAQYDSGRPGDVPWGGQSPRAAMSAAMLSDISADLQENSEGGADHGEQVQSSLETTAGRDGPQERILSQRIVSEHVVSQR